MGWSLCSPHWVLLPLQYVVNLSVQQAREAVEMRAQLEKKMAQKRKEEKEENLRALAQKAREERAGIRRADGKTQ